MRQPDRGNRHGDQDDQDHDADQPGKESHHRWAELSAHGAMTEPSAREADALLVTPLLSDPIH
jgi:hypothetical protein